jgi:hypothetical protein
MMAASAALVPSRAKAKIEAIRVFMTISFKGCEFRLFRRHRRG